MASTSALHRDLGKLRIEGVTVYDAVLGKGGYGKVYKAVLDDGTKAAAKELLPPDDANDCAVAKFFEECHQLKKLSEKNPRYIVRFYGVYYPPAQSQYAAQPQVPLLIMELMDTSLYDCISRPEKSPFALDRDGAQISILNDVAKGLKLLHTHQLVHRDLTPRNVLLRKDKLGIVIAKISDLGVARMISGSETDLTRCPGAYNFMPPEAFHQHPVYTEKLDIYSFGLLMIYILTGKLPQPPYDRPSAQQVLPGVRSHDLFPLIERCLAKRPDLRPTAADILSYLQPFWLTPGLYVRGLCTNEECTAYGEVICKLGFVCFDLGADSPMLRCLECNNHISPVQFVFHKCTGKCEGRIWYSFGQPEEKINWDCRADDCIPINLGANGRVWNSLIVEAKH